MQSLAKNKLLFWSVASFTITAAIGVGILAIWNWNKPCPVNTEKRVWGNCYRDLQAKPLTIGVAIGAPDEDYSALATHIQNQLNVPVVIDQDTPYEQIPKRIADREWDIAFTRSPIFSIAAEDNQYTGVALMFPEEGAYYRAALYVREDSSIQSLADINSQTTIALGRPESAPTFHLPIYTLYGKSLRVGIGYPPREAIGRVKAGEIDVGAGRYTAVKKDPSLRIVAVSKAIPNPGVYLSPRLADRDRDRITEAILDAPPAIQESARYGNSQIPNYNELRKIIARTESILGCPGFSLNSFNLNQPVNLYCSENPAASNSIDSNSTIEGQVTEYKVISSNEIEFIVVSPTNQIYRVLVSKQILNQIPLSPIATVDNFVQMSNVQPQPIAAGSWRVTITNPKQLALVNDVSID